VRVLHTARTVPAAYVFDVPTAPCYFNPAYAVETPLELMDANGIEVALTSVLCTALATLSILQFDAIPKPTNFEAGAALISSQLQPGDVGVVVGWVVPHAGDDR